MGCCIAAPRCACAALYVYGLLWLRHLHLEEQTRDGRKGDGLHAYLPGALQGMTLLACTLPTM